MAIISWLIGSRLGRGVAMAGGLILAFLTLRWKIRADKEAERELDWRRDQDKRRADAAKAGKEAKDEVAGMSDADLDKRLRDEGWS